MIVSVVILFPWIVCWIASPWTISPDSPLPTNPINVIQPYFALPILMTSTLFGMVGAWLCLAAACDVKGNNYLVVTIGLNALGLALSTLGMFDMLVGWSRNLASFLPCVAATAFIPFARRIAIHLQRRDICQLAFVKR